MRVYISGSITNNPNFKEDFKKARRQIEAHGNKVIDPSYLIDVYPDGEHDEYMDICMSLLDKADAIYMLEGWEYSKGAIIEYAEALKMGLTDYRSWLMAKMRLSNT